MKKSLLSLLFLMMFFGITKAETIQIGSGNANNPGVPTVTNWKYCYSQQIYTIAEIGKTGNITSIAFKINSDPGQDRNIDIYLVKTSKSSFSSGTDFVPVSESDKVFSGEVYFTAGEWTALEFSKSFSYDGSANLCVVLNDKTGSYTGSGKFFRTFEAENQAITRYNDNYGAYDPASPGSTETNTSSPLLTYKSQIQLTFADGGSGGGSGETIQIGSGTASGPGMPIYSNWKYGLTQQIYTSEEIGKTGTITSIAFKAVQDMGQAQIFDIYLVKTNKSTFDDAQDYISASESDKVFSGTVTFAVGDWTTLTLDKPFDYDGSANLCLIVNSKTGPYPDSSAKSWLVYSSTNQSIWRLNDGYGPYDPASPKSVASGPSPKFVNYKSQLQLTFAGSSGTPIHSVYVNGYEPPVAGEKATDHMNVTVPSDAHYYVDWVGWNDDDANTYFYDTFVAGTYYSLGVDLKANDGYYFADDCIFYLNGVTELVDNYYTRVGSDNNKNAYLWSVSTAATSGGGSGSEETIQVGSGSGSDGRLPTASFWKYDLTEQIYTSADIDKTGTITSIAFYQSSGFSDTRNLDVYLVHTNKTSFTDKSDYITPTAADLVFSGNVDISSESWFEIRFSKPFEYNGTQNLALIINDKSGYWTNNSESDRLVYNTDATSEAQSLFLGSDAQPFDIQNFNSSVSGSVFRFKNQIQLTFEIAGALSTAEWYAYATYSMDGADWGETFINFSMQDVSTVQAVSPVLPENWAAAFADGYVWFITKDYGDLCRAPLYTETNSLGDYEVVVSGFETEGVAKEMAYNVADGKIYYLIDYNSGTKLKSFSPNDLSNVGGLTFDLVIQAFAINKNGEAYGIEYQTGKLYRINLADVHYTLVGETGLAVSYVQCMAFDMETDELFWAQISGVSDVGIYKVNTATAVATYIGKTGTNGAELTGLFMLPSNAAKTAYIDFETGDFSQFTFENGSEYPWIVTSSDAADGTYCMMSGNAGVASSRSAIIATYTFDEDGYIYFDAKCMGEGVNTVWDPCVFSIDNNDQFVYGARGDTWYAHVYPVAAGTHTFKWEYWKDSSQDPLGDAFFVDNIQFLQGSSALDVIATGVKEIDNSHQPSDLNPQTSTIYNLAGQKIANGKSSNGKLPRGINIINGRKILNGK